MDFQSLQDIANGDELKPNYNPPNGESGYAALSMKISDKSDGWERRNQLGLAMIPISVTKTVFNKIIAINTCREEYLLLQRIYGGALTVT